MYLIPLRQQWSLHRPYHSDVGIVPNDAPIFRRRILFGALIHHFRRFADDLKTVGEPRWHIEKMFILLRQFHAGPFPVIRRTLSDIGGHVVNLSSDTKYKLALRPGIFLIMESSQGPPCRSRIVVLDEMFPDSGPGKVRILIELKEKPPIIAEDPGLDKL